MLDPRFSDADADQAQGSFSSDPDDDDEREEEEAVEEDGRCLDYLQASKQGPAEIYAEYEGRYRRRFKWLRSDLYSKPRPRKPNFGTDSNALLGILQTYGEVGPGARTPKLKALHSVAYRRHSPTEKVLVFSQFADTVLLSARGTGEEGRGVTMAGVTGGSVDPTDSSMARKFSPVTATSGRYRA